MPRHLGDVEEQPLTSSILHAGLFETDLHRTAWMHEDTNDCRIATRSVFTQQSLEEIDDAADDREAVCEVSDALHRLTGQSPSNEAA